jgi:hypothetical protein
MTFGDGKTWLCRACAALLATALVLWLPAQCSAYAVLAHEALIDVAWDTSIRPLLEKRFPNATKEQLREAHGYAYGGAIIQDMGYYPHGNMFFSDLAHYVRSGDFVIALLRDAKDINEYAFALGALSHYAADNDGHRLGTNRAVPVLYPKLEKKYGDVVTYEQDPLAHVKTEFGFDVIQVAKKRYAPDGYHDFIGFGVASPLLERAFRETYGLDLKTVLTSQDKVLGSYRRDVSKLIPQATRIAWALKKDEIMKDEPGITKRRFLYHLSRASYEREWGKNYQKPTPWERFLAFLYKILPKFGPLKILQLRTPTPQTEQMFEASFIAALHRYENLLREYDEGRLALPNDNFDVGDVTPPGGYRMNDDTHAALLDKLAERNFAGVSRELRAELLAFYADPNAPDATKRKAKVWSKVEVDLQKLKSTPAQENADPTLKSEAVSREFFPH